jgi:pyruvate dehydrogenase E2 component (dihydrolipoamide acetyltransferase)
MDIRLPKLGEGADSGSVVNIFVSEGDAIQKDQDILELENEKAVAPIPSPVAGKVIRVHIKVGDEISAGQVMISVDEVKTGTPEEEVKDAPQVESKQPVAVSGTFEYQSKTGFPPPASPSVRKMASDLGIDLSKVRGSGRGGRITGQDLKGFIQALQQGPAVSETKAPVSKRIDFSKWGEIDRKPLSGIRRAIARKMGESWATIPHVTQFAEADITDLMTLIKEQAPLFEKKKARLTLTAIILKLTARVLSKYPIVNSSLDISDNTVIYKKYIHIGVAVDTDKGLIVPVLRDADKKSLVDICLELDELADKTRKHKISTQDLSGGSFTISNLGGIGGGHFTPIINTPEVAVLAISRGQNKPVVKDGKVAVRMILPLGLSYDHRVIDGADGARFVMDMIRELENIKVKDF